MALCVDVIHELEVYSVLHMTQPVSAVVVHILSYGGLAKTSDQPME